jgi:hypothetical protein
MKLPGLAWLELSVGWRSISPFHGVVFGGMLQNITAAAERADRAGGTPLPVRR